MVDKEEILKILYEQFICYQGKIDIQDDGRINASKSVSYVGSGNFPVKFHRVEGNFECEFTNIISLEGAPEIVDRTFDCRNNPLKDLQGGPKTVGRDLITTFCPLESLVGAPSSIGGHWLLDYHPDLPLLRTLVASNITLSGMSKYKYAYEIREVLNKFAGQGKRGVLDCTKALLTLEKELGINIRANIRW